MKVIKLLFYKILFNNNDDNKDIFFSVCNNYTNKQVLEKNLISLLINYKSFCNKNRTIRYIKNIKSGNYNLNRVLYYLTNGFYCKIMLYLNFKNKEKINMENINLDFKDNTINTYKYNNKFYDPDEIYINEELFKRYKYEILKNELITDEYLYVKDKYLNLTIYNKLIT